MNRMVGLASLLICMASINANVMAEEGSALYASKGCIGCHGPDGKKPIMPMAPMIAGQNEEYLINQLNDIKLNKRNNGQTAMMMGIMTAVSNDEIKIISKWLSEVK